MGDNIECLTLNTIVNIIDSSGNKYIFNGLTNYDSNKVFGLAIGNYVFQDISFNHPMALLNNDVSNLISYSGDSSKKLEKRVGDISYDFYYGDINVSVNGDFSGLSVYCKNDVYMGGENLLKYSEICHKTSTTIQPSNALKCLSYASRVNIISFNENLNKYVFNNDLAYDPTLRYGLYDGTYVLQNILESHPLAILNYNISGVLTYTGDINKKYIKLIDDISYDFYYGDISINVYGPFGTASITCYNHPVTMRMDNIFNYSIFCNPGAIISSPPEISYVFDNNNIIVSQNNSNQEKNYYVNYNNAKRPWKVNTSYISHYNELYANESLKQKGDNKDYNFQIDASKNNLRIESVDSNIDIFTHNDNSINFQGKTNFNNNSYFNKSITFEESVVSKKTITTTNLLVSDISVGILRISDNLTANIIGNIKIEGSLDVIGQVKDDSGNVVQGSLLNNYTIQNSKLNDSSLNNANINNSLIGFTTPSQAIFTDVSINNLAIENDIIINNNLKLKNIEENGYIYATLSSNISSSNYKIYNNDPDNYHVLFYIPDSDLVFEPPNANTIPNDDRRELDENSFKHRFYLEKNNIYYFNFFDSYLSYSNYTNKAIGLYFNNESNIDIKYNLNNASVDTVSINTKKYYIIYHKDFTNDNTNGNNKDSISLNIKGNFDFCDLVLLNTTTTSFSILKTFEKVFLYKHDFNLIDKIEIVDNSINTLLTSNYDASFRNLIISSDTSLNQKLFVANDVSFNNKLFVANDVSFNNKLFVADDVSFNNKLFVANDVSFNNKLFVANDVSFNNKLFVANDVSFNNKLFVSDSFDVDGPVNFNNNTNSTNFDNGALKVTGGVGIGRNLHVKENVTINSNATSTSSVTGALKVIGGVGISENLNVEKKVTINSNATSTSSVTGALKVTGGVGINENLNVGNNLNVGQNVTINSTGDSTSTTNGSLVVDGGVGIAKNLNVGKNLNVEENVIINSTDDSTLSTNGSLIVKGGTGILKNLNVDGDVSLNSNVDISGNLNVLNKVHFKDGERIGSLDIAEQNFVVDGSVGITQKLIVGESVSFIDNTSSGDISEGALTVNGGVGIGQNLNVGQNVTINSITSSSNSNTGALTVGGGVGIVENLNVGQNVTINSGAGSSDINTGALKVSGGVGISENLNIGQNLNVTQNVTINSQDDSTNSTSGALIVDGGVGIEKKLNVKDLVKFFNESDSNSYTNGALVVNGGVGIAKNLNVNGNTFINNTLHVNGIVNFNNTTNSNATNNGALIVDGGVGIAENLNVGGTFTSNIQSVLNINSTLTPQNVFQPLVPTGAVMSFATKGAPQGWLACNGQTLSRTNYQNLFAVIGTTWDTGVGINDFAIPNLNGVGYFIRGGIVDGAYNPDSTKKPTNNFNISANQGTTSSEGAHDHALSYNSGGSPQGHDENAGNLREYPYPLAGYSNGTAYGLYGLGSAGEHNHTINTTITTNINDTSTWDNETAPKNVILLYCIKY